MGLGEDGQVGMVGCRDLLKQIWMRGGWEVRGKEMAEREGGEGRRGGGGGSKEGEGRGGEEEGEGRGEGRQLVEQNGESKVSTPTAQLMRGL